jgi:hypothetical protein
MAQVDFTPAPTFRAAAPKAKMTIYFALLIVALVALIVGCVFLFLEIRRFGGFGAVQGRVAAIEHDSRAVEPANPAGGAAPRRLNAVALS